MPAERIDEVLLQKYLLGKLSEQEQVRIEDRSFTDPAYLGTLEAAEADLIDAYVRGELSEHDRRQFERLFLTSRQRRNKVEFAKALATVSAESTPPEFPAQEHQSVWQAFVNLLRVSNPALRFAAGMAALVLVAGMSWLAVQNIGMRSRMAALEAQGREMRLQEQSVRQQLSEEQARAANLAAQSPKPSADSGRPRILASLVFLPGLSRARTSVQQLILNSTALLAHIEIQLEPRDEYPRYRVELHTGRGDDVLARSNLTRHRTSSGYAVSFDVPSNALASGAYELALKGVDGHSTDIGYYYFRVVKQ